MRPHTNRSIFAARYRLAKSWKEINFGRISQKTQNSYFAALRVQLAHNALEALAKAIGKKNVRDLQINDQKLSKSFRSIAGKRLLDCLINFANEDSKKRLLEWISNTDDYNLSIISAITRHSHAHGHFTAYGCGIAESLTAQKMLNSLADKLLDACDLHFGNFLDSLIEKRTE